MFGSKNFEYFFFQIVFFTHSTNSMIKFEFKNQISAQQGHQKRTRGNFTLYLLVRSVSQFSKYEYFHQYRPYLTQKKIANVFLVPSLAIQTIYEVIKNFIFFSIFSKFCYVRVKNILNIFFQIVFFTHSTNSMIKFEFKNQISAQQGHQKRTRGNFTLYLLVRSVSQFSKYEYFHQYRPYLTQKKIANVFLVPSLAIQTIYEVIKNFIFFRFFQNFVMFGSKNFEYYFFFKLYFLLTRPIL